MMYLGTILLIIIGGSVSYMGIRGNLLDIMCVGGALLAGAMVFELRYRQLEKGEKE